MTATSHRIGLASAALVALLVFSGCSSSGDASGTDSSDSGGSITIGLGQPFNTFEFEQLTSVSDYQFAKEVIEPLVVPDDTGEELRPAFAESYSYDDTGTVLTFDISEDATWSDGTPATSADVAFSYDLWMETGNGPLLAAITSVETPTPQEVVMTLAQPSSSLLSVLSWASTGVVMNDFGGRTREEYFQDPIGTGPYIVESWMPGGSMVLKRNETYHGEVQPILDEVRLELIDDPNQRALQFESGQLDVVEYVSPEMAAQYDQDILQVTPAAGTTSLYFNTASGPFTDVNLRKAVSLAVDRQALVDSVYGGYAGVATAMLTPLVPGAIDCEECDYPTRDLDAAKAALAQSTYDGETLVLSVNSTTGRNVLAAQALQPMLAEAGIKITVAPDDQSTLLDAAIAGTHEFMLSDYNATSPTLNDALSFYAQTDAYWTYVGSDQFLASAAAVDQARTTEELEAAAAGFEAWSYRTMWAAPVATISSIFAVQPRVHGLVVTPIALYNLSSVSVSD